MTTIATARPTIQRPDAEYLVDDAQLAAAAFLVRYSGWTLDAYRHDLRGYFQSAADSQVPVLEATRPISSCTAPGWNNAAWQRQRSTGGSRPSAASTDSPTSMAGSGRTRPSTFAAHRSILRMPAASTALSWVCSSSPQSSTTATTRCSPCCSGSTGCGSARRAPPTSRTLASNGATAPCASSARQQARHHPARAPHGANHRPRRGRTLRGSDPAPARRPAP